MATVYELLNGRNDTIDYSKIIKQWPWIVEQNQLCIIDPDSDGLLCGLFISHFLNWNIAGFYDGKVLVLRDRVSPSDCIFVDREIFRQRARSIGHHMVLFNARRVPENWSNFEGCIQPNNLREYDFWKMYQLKYPLATIHLLIGIVSSVLKVNVPTSAICPLLFTDGTWMNLFEYTENCLDWVRYLQAKDVPGLQAVFCNEHYSVHTMMVAMNDFLRERDAICAAGEKGKRERGDRLILSTNDGPFNLVSSNGQYSIAGDARIRAEQFLKLLESLTHWGYRSDIWAWDNLTLRVFSKKIFTKKSRLSNRDFGAIISENPLSYAISSNLRVEYTLEEPDRLS